MFRVSSVARFKIPPRSILFIEVSSGRSKLLDVSSFFLSVLSLDVFKNKSQEQDVKIMYISTFETFEMPYHSSVKLIKSYFDQRLFILFLTCSILDLEPIDSCNALS